jgi:hypothetical protein
MELQKNCLLLHITGKHATICVVLYMLSVMANKYLKESENITKKSKKSAKTLYLQ